MGEVIDFEKARLRLRSIIKDQETMWDMIENGYDPCDVDDIEEYRMRCELVDKLTEGMSFSFKQDYIYEPDLSAFFDEDNK